MAWSIKGSYFETCSCELMCPCNLSFDHGATYDYCRVTLVFHIREGEVEGTDVGGVKLAVIADTPKVMTEGNWKLGVFVDERASEEQQQAILDAYDGKLGGPLADLAGLIGETLGVERAAISHEVRDGKGTLTIGDVVHSEMHPFTGADGSTTTLRDSLFSTVPGSPAYVAVADKHEVRLPQYGMEWSLDGRNAIQADYRIRHTA